MVRLASATSTAIGRSGQGLSRWRLCAWSKWVKRCRQRNTFMMSENHHDGCVPQMYNLLCAKMKNYWIPSFWCTTRGGWQWWEIDPVHALGVDRIQNKHGWLQEKGNLLKQFNALTNLASAKYARKPIRKDTSLYFLCIAIVHAWL